MSVEETIDHLCQKLILCLPVVRLSPWKSSGLRDHGALERVGGDAYVKEVSTFTPAPGLFREYMRILREKWIARETVTVGSELEEAALSPAGAPDLESLVQQALGKIAGMFETRASDEGRQVSVCR